MNEAYFTRVAAELAIQPRQVAATARLFTEGATVPFIARYRKEATGSLDEVAITNIRDRLVNLAELDQRREAILKSLEERNLLTDALKTAIAKAETLTALEDIYLPYRPKRRTRATIAKEKGLEPLAEPALRQPGTADPLAEAQAFRQRGKGRRFVEEALAGARDILAERVSDDATAREQMRALYSSKGVGSLQGHVRKEEAAAKFKDYFDWSEPLAKTPSHRMLAMRRGEEEGFLIMRIEPPEEEALADRTALCQSARRPAAEQVALAVQDSYKRLLGPAIEVEMRLESKKRADSEAIRVFAENLRELLLAPPLGRKNVLAIDPGFRTGCKVVCLDRQGKLLHHDVDLSPPADARVGEAAEAVRSALPEIPDRGHRHRQRHRRPGDRGLRPRARAARSHPRRHGQRERRLHLLRLRSRPRGIPRPRPDGARRGLHRPPADGPAGRTGQDRPQVHRRRPVPARCGSARAQAQPGRRGDELRQRRRRRASTPPASSC